MLKSSSPNQIHEVVLQEMIVEDWDKKDNKVVYGYYSFRIYYGNHSGSLARYNEIKRLGV
ncbi:hypothetical protein CEQ21_02075 [Niallia circulans]|uniref:Uncharacterized protein n=1 Tax=Niallia circulans TaxID=1397 RepID=A0A553SRY4_NIACI|nr:hypothetical protein CEQ21_02075 [Niallia circulans]